MKGVKIFISVPVYYLSFNALRIHEIKMMSVNIPLYVVIYNTWCNIADGHGSHKL